MNTDSRFGRGAGRHWPTGRAATVRAEHGDSDMDSDVGHRQLGAPGRALADDTLVAVKVLRPRCIFESATGSLRPSGFTRGEICWGTDDGYTEPNDYRSD